MLWTFLNFLVKDIMKNKTSLFSGIALLTTALGLSLAIPVFATGFEQRVGDTSAGLSPENSQLLPTSPQLIARRNCVNRRIYHAAYYTRGVFGRRVFHKAYYQTKRVCR